MCLVMFWWRLYTRGCLYTLHYTTLHAHNLTHARDVYTRIYVLESIVWAHNYMSIGWYRRALQLVIHDWSDQLWSVWCYVVSRSDAWLYLSLRIDWRSIKYDHNMFIITQLPTIEITCIHSICHDLTMRTITWQMFKIIVKHFIYKRPPCISTINVPVKIQGHVSWFLDSCSNIMRRACCSLYNVTWYISYSPYHIVYRRNTSSLVTDMYVEYFIVTRGRVCSLCMDVNITTTCI